MPEIPFVPGHEELRSVIRTSYIKPLALWLLGNRPDRILAQESNSSWESAMTIDFFVEATDIFRRYNEEEHLCQTLEEICPKVCKWLLSTCVVVAEGFCSWEKVTWDTAVILKTLLTCMNRFPSSFTGKEKIEILENSKKAIKWLNHRFRAWEEEVRYPFGPADVAQILITGLYVKQHCPKLFGEFKVLLEQLHRDIVKYLVIQAAEPMDIHLENGSFTKATWWGDYFQTAEVLESLALYYDDIKNSNDEDDRPLKTKIEKAAFDACKYIERTQHDGMWGTHVDTIRTLYTYVRVSTLVHQVSCQPHLTFKALRWICDEKQRLADGSFLHTMFLTIFMGPALVVIHNDWPLACKSVIEAYDQALWASPAQTSAERIRRFEAETHISTLQGTLEGLKEQLSRRGKGLKTVILSIGVFFLVLWLGWLSESLTINITVKTVDLFKILPIVATGYVAVLIAIWRR